MKGKPLEGIRIVEFSSMVTAAMAAMMLSEQGASTTKVEPLGIGDTMRHLGSAVGGVSGLFVNCNRGKESIALDLKSAEGVAIARALCLEADVLISNYRPGVLERLGLGSETLRAQNPRLVCVAISGFGTEGPLAAAPAYDHVIQGLCGFTAVQGTEGQREFVRTLICDEITAYTASQAVTAALFQRERTGAGQHIDLSMLDAALYFIWPAGMMDHTIESEAVVRRPPLKDLYKVHATRDGAVSLAAITEAHWRGVAAVLGLPEGASDGASAMERSAATIEHLAEAIAAWRTKDLLSALRAQDVPCAECLSLEEVFEHPQVHASGAVQRVEHPALGALRTPAHPARFGALQFAPAAACALLGEHTREVLTRLGHDADSIAGLLRRGVVQAPDPAPPSS